MPDYSNSKIYKLVSKDLSHDLIYIGSTCQELRNRLAEHTRDYRKYTNNKYHWVSSFELFNKGGVDIILLEDVNCENKAQLHARERHYIESTKCVNKVIPTRTPIEWREDNNEYIKEKNKERYILNRDDMNIIFYCRCGGTYFKRHLKRHLNTYKHTEYISENTN